MSRGRGRGRGRGKPCGPSGEPAPPPILQPPPLYPALDRRPLQLRCSESEDYLVTIKQDLKQHALASPFFLVEEGSKLATIARYSDKYRKNGENKGAIGWAIDWSYFPKELRVGGGGGGKKSKNKTKRLPQSTSNPGKKRGNAKTGKDVRNNAGHSDDGPPKAKKRRRVTFGDSDADDHGGGVLVKKLDVLEKAEQLSAESEQSAEEEIENAEEAYDEHDDEERTDYNLTYFDNGEDNDIGGEDEALEGPVY